MENRNNTRCAWFGRLKTLHGGQLSQCADFARRVLRASDVEIHIMDGDGLTLVHRSGTPSSFDGSFAVDPCELRKATDILVRDLETLRGRGGFRQQVAVALIRLADGTLAGSLSAYLPPGKPLSAPSRDGL